MLTVDRLRIRNFKRYRDQGFDFSGHRLTLIVGDNRDSGSAGSNGAGKTGLFSALCWLLYGVTEKGERADDVVNEEVGRDCRVEGTLADTDGRTYELVRTRKAKGRKANDLTVAVDGVDITKSNVAETQLQIDGILGMDYRTFVNSVVFPQGAAQYFGGLTDAEQKAVLERILGLGELTEYQDRAKAALKGVEREKAEADSELSRENGIIETLRDELSSLQENDRAWKGDRERRVAELRERKDREARGLAKRAEELEEREQGLKKEKRKTAAAQKGLEQRFDDLAKRERKARDAIVKAGMRKTTVQAERDQLIGEADRVRSELEGKAECPLCGQPLTGDKVGEHADALKRKAGSLEPQIKELERKARNAEEAHAALSSEVDALAAEKAENDKERQGLNERERDLARDKADLDASRKADAELEKRIRETEAEANPFAPRIAKVQGSLGEKEEHAAALQGRVGELASSAEKYAFWRDAFGNQGLRSFILDAVIPVLNEHVAEYGRVLTDGEIRVSFHAQEKLKSGEMRERFGMDIESEASASAYRKLSNGERRRVDLAILMALRDMVQSRASKQFGMVFADEIFDGLDAEGIERAVRLVGELARTECRVFVITQRDDLRQNFSDVVTVVKEGGVSRIAA